MKTNVIYQALIFMILVVVLMPMSVHAESATNSESVNDMGKVVNKHKSPDASYEIPTTIKRNTKKILINESREMSPFFKLGIAINIVMILVFGWWFSKEWRRKK